MENYVCLALWLICFFSDGSGQRIGNPDDLSKIERPCPTYDLNCIRAFFQSHAHCNKSSGPVPDPINRPQTNLFLPRINISISTTTLQVSGLNGRVEEFFINRETDRLVIALDFRTMNQSTDNVYFKFHRRAKEPIVTRGSGSITYANLVITAVIPNIDNLQLQDAECTTYSNGAMPILQLSPTAGLSSDPQTAVGFTSFLTEMPVNIQEFFLTDSAFYIATFIQYSICDFGLFLS